MKTIHYNQSRFDTADAIAGAVLAYAEALATRQRFAVIDIPTVTPTGVATAHMLIGPGIALAASPTTDESVPQDLPRDEFGGESAQLQANGISDLDVRRTVRTLTEGTVRVRLRISATPLEGETLIDGFGDEGAV